MIKDSTNVYRYRLNFGKIQSALKPPNFVKNQLDSYDSFLLKSLPPDQREGKGLEAVFRSVFPITDYSDKITIDYIHYRLGDPKYEFRECKARGLTYATPLRVLLRLIQWELDEVTQIRRIKEIKEQEIYFGEFPLMTENGSFIINGTERSIVSQLHKSPGVNFSHDKGKTHAGGKLMFSAGIIPQRGSWLDFEFDSKDILHVKIDRKKKFLSTQLLKALGYSNVDLLKMFYFTETFNLKNAFDKEPSERTFTKEFSPDAYLNQRTVEDILHPETGEVVIPAKRKITKVSLKRLQEADVKVVPSSEEDIVGRYSLYDVSDAEGNIIVESNGLISEAVLDSLLQAGIEQIELLYIGPRTIGSAFRDTIAGDKTSTTDEAAIEIFRKMKPGEPPTLEVAKTLIQNMFFSSDRYDLSRVGRMKMNRKLGEDKDLEQRVLDNDDIIHTIEYLLKLKEGIGEVDDIDHLGNRRVRGVGELLENRFRVGLVRMERAIKEKLAIIETDSISLTEVVNAKPVIAVVNEFFGSSQLSQFMDQTNPLSEITHKRRLSALGPGGLVRDRAGFEVRDVHNSHYGRICPVETPEGPNIGLISSLTTFSRLNEYGFIETPYRVVENSKASDQIEYLSALMDDKAYVASANTKLDEEGNIVDEFISVRVAGEFKILPRDVVQYMDVSPNQLVSVAASLIPFLEHDDANRALMGSNMQRQAVPLVRPQAPYVGTGMEHQVAVDSGTTVLCKRGGYVDKVDAGRIVIIADSDLEQENIVAEANVDIYDLRKYERSNQNTSINQRPLVIPGQRVEEGQVLADGASTDSGELALGQNILIAFMPWNGYNYEDSIVVSEKVLKDDRFTSVHIEELDVQTRDTKLGKEIITKDLPNVSEHALANLDDTGIIRLGSYVKSGDILIGKTTPKGESQLNPEEKLLRAIFGDKAGDVKDTSLRVPQGMEGVVIDVKIFSRKGSKKSKREELIHADQLAKIEQDYIDEIRIIKNNLAKHILKIAKDSPVKYDVIDQQTNAIRVAKGDTLTGEIIASLPHENWKDLQVIDEDINARLSIITRNAFFQLQCIENVHYQRRDKASRQDDLMPGVIQNIKVYIAIKRRLSVGDKMAGRHGNKGVISKIVPVEDMPYMENGDSVDIVLNPLGVPSRMNVGQVLETHLGLVAKRLGNRIQEMMDEQYPPEKVKEIFKSIYKSKYVHKFLDECSDSEFDDFKVRHQKNVWMSTPVFDGATEKEMHKLMDLCGLEHSGQVTLYDGRTGDQFEQKVTIGYMYMLKLHHLVDEKIHARSTGPYSLITQQPLGGKAQFGGQRFGEMEVWALEAYGAAHTLRELLTVKSDDVIGRNKTYEAIVKGNNPTNMGIPESFKVLINEMRSLCLDFKIIKDIRFLDSEIH